MDSGLLTSIKRSENNLSMDLDVTKSGISIEKFWSAVTVYITRPHVINRNICGIQIRNIVTGTCPIDGHAIYKSLKSAILDCNKRKEIGKVLKHFGIQDICDQNSVNSVEGLIQSTTPITIAITVNVIPKNISTEEDILEIIIIDKFQNYALFVPDKFEGKARVLPELSFKLHLANSELDMEIFNEDDGNSCKEWLKNILFPRISKWCLTVDDNPIGCTPSLELVDILEYNRTYQDLKRKYAQNLISMWNESTDPSKFVHEDLAIASYLLVLWRDEYEVKTLTKKQSFLDMGCGNGLLVYLLNSEGHPGIGIDIKRRKIWDQYPDFVTLLEDPVQQPSDKLYPEYDWLIGNHSDELTPWIPIIASKSSYSTNFFIIPCCAYNFYSKYQRTKSGISQYCEYLEYVNEIAEVCGFLVKRDKLRIPSTKRICFLGQGRSYGIEQWRNQLQAIECFIKNKSSDKFEKPVFKVRNKIERVRNCTHLRPEVKSELVLKVANALLNSNNISKQSLLMEEKSSWNKGRKMPLMEVASVFTPQELNHMKRECGGLQTLLKNHRNIFYVSRGEVQLRIPQPASELNVSEDLLRTKECWFHLYHPDGCPLKKEDCAYKHSSNIIA